MTLMPPGEHLDGTTADCAHLHLLLACFRASPPPMRLPGVTGRPLPDVAGTEVIDADVFHTGYAIMAARYEQLGIRALLPLERVWVGICSAAGPGTARSHGGFHYPAQGYRHIQMDAAVTVFGDLTGTARRVDGGAVAGVPGHPSRHGANIGAHRSRPMCQVIWARGAGGVTRAIGETGRGSCPDLAIGCTSGAQISLFAAAIINARIPAWN